MTYTPTDLSYFAGIIDGEGCLYVTPSPPHEIFLWVSNTDSTLGSWLVERFGGHVYLDRSGQRRRGHRIVHRWVRRGLPLLPLLRALQPHVVVKRRQVEVLIQILELKAHKQATGQAELSVELRALRL